VSADLATLRPVVCVIADRHRDLALAADARAGRFTHAGVTLTLGRRPDWIDGGLAGDEEWRIEWVKLYEGLDLAHAFAVTGEEGYLWAGLVESFCEQVPVGFDSSDVTARRLQNWIYAWQRFVAAPGYPGLPHGLEARLTARIEADTVHLAAHLTAQRNHRTLELYTLLLVGIALGAPDRARTALRELALNAGTDIWDDGVHRECSTDYHLIVLRSLVGAVANARAAGLDVPAQLLDRAGRAADFALHIQRPDGLTPAISDGDQGDFRPLLDLAARVLDRADLAWAASGGTRGTAPVGRSVGFPVGGYYVQRSGWGTGERPYAAERFCLFDAGPLGDGGHGHYDALSVEIAANGHPLLVDPGRYTYAENGDGWRHWFKGTAAHNTVCVDGLDQTRYRSGRPKGPTATARLLGRFTAPGLDVLCGQVRSPVYEVVHTRTVAFVDDDYWLVHDRLVGQRSHRFVARWQLTPAASGATTLTRRRGHTTVRAPGLVLAVPQRFGAVSLAAGWVAPTYGVKHPAPAVLVAAAGRACTDLITAIVPGGVPVSVTVSSGPRTTWARVQRPGRGVDRVWWSTDGTVAGRERLR
jgi:Heparinase II/III-like protein/Heparinase II/III N-terminus